MLLAIGLLFYLAPECCARGHRIDVGSHAAAHESGYGAKFRTAAFAKAVSKALPAVALQPDIPGFLCFGYLSPLVARMVMQPLF